MNDEDRVYQRIGEFVVSFQWIEDKLREIGWFILDPERKQWPPIGLRDLTNERLINRVHELFIQALPKCSLSRELEANFRELFAACVGELHEVRRARNRVLHSAFIELKAGGEVQGLMRSDPRFDVDAETGEPLFDRELLTPDSFSREMTKMGEAAMFLGRAHTQLIHKYPTGGGRS